MTESFSSRDYVVSVLDGMAVNVRCGIHPWEKHPERPNKLVISVKLYAHLHAARVADVPIMDYDAIRKFVKGLEAREHIDFLEEIIDDITGACFADARVEACHVSVRKPAIFNDVDGVGVDAFRTRARWSAG